ncbi:MAG: hypothetical protein ABSE79_01615 [Terriglobia bacterium]
MAPFSEVLINQLNALETRFKFLARHLPEAGELLDSVGRPVPHDLLRELANSGEQFEAIKSDVLRVSEPIAALPRTSELSSIKDLRAFMEAVSDVVAKQTAHRNIQQAACGELEKVLTITHVNGIEFTPLLQCQEKARELRDSIAGTGWPDTHPDADALARGQHVFSGFVKFVSFHDNLEDEEWERLQDLVNQSFGKPLGLAASRGKLVMSTSVPPVPPVPVSVAQPATPTEPTEEIAPTEKVAADAVPPSPSEKQGEDLHREETPASVQLTAEPPSPTLPVTGGEAVAEPEYLKASGEPVTEPVGILDPIDADSKDQRQDSPALESPEIGTTAGTYEGTLDDIRYMLVLDLIDGKGMAKVLSNKITAASNAAAGGDKKTAEGFLKAFINEVNAQTGKHISGAAPQLLLTDANRLLDQLQ